MIEKFENACCILIAHLNRFTVQHYGIVILEIPIWLFPPPQKPSNAS
jgi:hypothetical protein